MMIALRCHAPWRSSSMGSTRRGDQSLLQYCADHREARRELEKHKIAIPDSISGWLLLRRSSLTYEQRQMVQTHCTSLEESKVEESLYYLFGQDYKGRSECAMGSKCHSCETSSTLASTTSSLQRWGDLWAWWHGCLWRGLCQWVVKTRRRPTMRTLLKATMMPHGMDKLLRRLRMAITRTMKTLVTSTVPWRKPMLPTLTLDVNLQTFVQLVDTILWLLWRRMHHRAVLDNNIQFLLVMAKARWSQEEKENQKGQVQRAEEKVPIHLERAHLPQGLQPTLGDLPTVSSVAKLDILQLNAQADHQSRKEHLPALPQRG